MEFILSFLNCKFPISFASFLEKHFVTNYITQNWRKFQFIY
jgi:hypothetical protein